MDPAPASPVGIIPAGQPLITIPSEIPSPTAFLYALLPPPSSPSPSTPSPIERSSHVVVFLLPHIQLPPNVALAIYLVTPVPVPGGGPTPPALPTLQHQFLGGIGPGKESAIFKLKRDVTQQGPGGGALVLGVSLEDAGSVAERMGQLAAAKQQREQGQGRAGGGGGDEMALVPLAVARGGLSTLVLAQKIIKSAFNFLTSFSAKAGPGEVEVVPVKAFEEWWRKFESRVRSDPGFLERDSADN